jgi:ankyrin repeat protein
MSSYKLSTIHAEFQCIKDIQEIKQANNIMAFLEDMHCLFNSKAVSNPRGPLGRSLIYYAAMGDCSELLYFLLKNGAAKDDLNRNKCTPLSWAAEFGLLTSAKILLKHGAEINLMDNINLTPLS